MCVSSQAGLEAGHPLVCKMNLLAFSAASLHDGTDNPVRQ